MDFVIDFVMDFVMDLAIDADRLKAWYRGEARTVLAQDRRGLWVRFPVAVLRPHVAREGVVGTFVLSVDERHRLKAFRRQQR